MSICLLPPCLQAKEIQSYVLSLLQIGYDNYYKLPSEHKEKIVTMIIKNLGIDAFDILLGDEIENTLDYFTSYLVSDSKNDALDFVEHLKHNALKHYEYEINELFQELKWSKAS